MTQLGEYIKMALKNIWANKVRTLLTMLGIVIGISSVILIMSVGNGATDMISSELGSLGKGQIVFYSNDYSEEYAITRDEMEEIKKIEGVKAVSTLSTIQGSVRTKKDNFAATVTLIDKDGFELYDYEFLAGGEFTESDAEVGRPVCVISEDDAMKMFGSTNVVGMDFPMTVFSSVDLTVKICGITKSKEKTAIESLYGDPTVQIYMPTRLISKHLGIVDDDEDWMFYVLQEDGSDSKQICKDVIHYLNVKHHCKDEEIYTYESFNDIMATVNNVIKLITVFVAFVASVSLVVGGIGVMNIMLVSVTERTREIGIRKALGAKTGSITIQFLAESAFITLLGGVIGIIIGISGAWGIAAIIGVVVPKMHFSPMISLGTILLASVFSTVVGLFFGIYPARKAAKLSPIEALRQN